MTSLKWTLLNSEANREFEHLHIISFLDRVIKMTPKGFFK